MQEEAGKLAERGLRKRRRRLLDEIESLLSEQSLAEWLSLLGEMCGGNGVVVENLYSIFMLEPLHYLHLGVSRLLKTCLPQYSCLKEIYSHRGSAQKVTKIELGEASATGSVQW